MPRLKITYKMAIILATMSFGPMLAGVITGMIPLENAELRLNREDVSRKLAAGCATHLSTKDGLALQKTCRAALNQVPDLKSIRILRHDGVVLYCSPDHNRLWTLSPKSPSTLDQLRVPLNRDGKIWAELEIAFDPSQTNFLSPIIRWLVLILVGFSLNFGSFSFFLGRALKVLDPKSAVPKRVRNTLDTIVGGVVILDAQGKILLVNDSFSKSVGLPTDNLLGKELNELPWRAESEEMWPWEYALKEHTQKTAVKVHLTVAEGSELSFVVNATPVLDGEERVSGALISFEDISIMEHQRKDLLQALNDLEASREQIRLQNEVLQELASRDGLTGAFNRRALFEKIDAIWETRNDGEQGLITIMMDVDHFKKLNDQHGHAAGDAVLKDVVKVVRQLVGTAGTLGRYGGEEFCVIMERATVEQGIAMAEHIRGGIQEHLANPYKVTASIGVSSSIFGAKTIQSQIEQSDKALYAAKHGGRNAVRCWSEQLEREAEEAERKKAAKLSSIEIEEHPISYHAVVTLNAAISQRNPSIAAHSHRVAEMCVSLARGMLPVGKLYVLEIAALMHDIGIIGITEDVVSSGHEWIQNELDRQFLVHRSTVGTEIIHAAIKCPELLEVLKYQHYTFGPREGQEICGEDLPIGARIVSMLNAYDALTSELNPTPLEHEAAIQVLRGHAGQLFDPTLVERFANSPLGWRPHGHFGDSGVSDQHAVMIGYQLERVIHSFDARNPAALKTRLQTLGEIAKQSDLPGISMIIQELASEADRKAVADWESLLPLLEDLTEICLMIQRAYLRSANVSMQELIEHSTGYL